jgi:hypothetical protein
MVEIEVKGIDPMRKPKTYFEQIPVHVVKQIAEEMDSDQLDSDHEEIRNKNVTVETPATKTEPYSVSVAMQCRSRLT